MSKKKLVILALLVALIVAFFAFDLGRFLSLDYIKSRQAEFTALAADKPLAVGGVFFAVYVAVCALSLPGAAISSARRSVPSVPRPEVGSSRHRTRGRCANATAISRARRSP